MPNLLIGIFGYILLITHQIGICLIVIVSSANTIATEILDITDFRISHTLVFDKNVGIKEVKLVDVITLNSK